jgi:hypothetical protein
VQDLEEQCWYQNLMREDTGKHDVQVRVTVNPVKHQSIISGIISVKCFGLNGHHYVEQG